MSVTWRDDPEVQKKVETLGGAYRLGKDVLRSMMATAVAADRRCLASEVAELHTETTDSEVGMRVVGAWHWVGRAEVLALLEQDAS